jgi:signal peptidase II
MLQFLKGRTPIYRDWTLLQLAALALALDQLTKFVVRQTLEWHHSWPATGLFRFTHIHNTGSAFGLFQDQNLPLLFVSLVGVLVLAYIYQSQERPTVVLRVSIALMLGGALGNLIDRIHQGHVTDFIDVGPWPVFNLADSAIVVGLIMMGWMLVMRRDQPETAAVGSSGDELVHADCPLCDGPMIALSNGARCADCGVRERIVPVADRER